MTAEQYLAFLYPYFSTVGDPRYVAPEIIASALLMAQSRRPPCLSEEQQNEAQAHYAAYALEQRRAQQAATDSATAGTTIVREKEGNVEVQYAAATESSQQVSGPATPYAAWKSLADLCAFGAVIVGDAWCGSGGPPP